MKLRNFLPILVILALVSCQAHSPKRDLQAERILAAKTVKPPPKDTSLLYEVTFERDCGDVQADVLFMSDHGPNEASFFDYGTKAVYRIGKVGKKAKPQYNTIMRMPPARESGSKWYTLVEFLSYGDECTVKVREISHNKNDRLNGTRMIELLKELKGDGEDGS